MNDIDTYSDVRQKLARGFRWLHLLLTSLLCTVFLAGNCQASGRGEGAGNSASAQNQRVDGNAIAATGAMITLDEIICPPFDVFDGGSAVRMGEGQSLRYQLAIGTTARECIAHANGSHTVNVGVQVLALLGPAGRPGTFSAPLRIAIKQGNKILATRTRQVSIIIPAGEAQATAHIVEEDFPLPEDTSGVLIEIGLGSPRR